MRARALIATGFGAPILDRYAADEIMQMADECRAGGTFHLIESAGLFEVSTDDGGTRAQPGESGELLLTGLFSWSMPFIRYRIGDRVTAGEIGCPCGARVATLRRVEGRTIDLFELPGGRRHHPHLLDLPLLASVPWLQKYQFAQESVERVVLRLLPRPAVVPPPEAAVDLERRIATVRSLPWTVRCEIVGDIGHRPGGKFRPYVPLGSSPS